MARAGPARPRVLAADHRAGSLHSGYICGDERLNGYDLLDAVGRLTDTTFAMARLFFSGQLTRFPGVTLVVSHSGGALP